MRSRKDAAEFVSEMLRGSNSVVYDQKHGKHHIGFIEVRAIMDYIYCGAPKSDDENIINDNRFKDGIP